MRLYSKRTPFLSIENLGQACHHGKTVIQQTLWPFGSCDIFYQPLHVDADCNICIEYIYCNNSEFIWFDMESVW